MNFPDLPHKPSIPVEKWECRVGQDELDRMNTLLKFTPRPRPTYENSGIEKDLGVSAEWMEQARSYWEKDFDWRKTEDNINSFRNYKAKVQSDKGDFGIHFIGLFSEKEDAVPLIMMHGWPGSFMEFLPLLRHLSSTYTASNLPVHLVIPSLVGFGFSSAPPLDRDFDTLDNATLMDSLMRGLGFENYVAQGGDIGHFNARLLGERFEACKAVHVNFFPTGPPANFDMASLDEVDRDHVGKMEYWDKWESSYISSQALKTSTTGTALDSNPIAVLAWIGEKFTNWAHPESNIPIKIIVDHAALYFLTQTSTTSLYFYRTSYGKRPHKDRLPGECKNKPFGYSQFKREILASPKAWVQAKTNLVFHRRHEKGGHFAALEEPVTLWNDVLDFIQIACKQETKRSNL